MEFTGFPVAALDFYDDLEVDNTKSFWEKHKHVYDEAVKAPMMALCDALGRSSATRRSSGPTATCGSPRTRRRTRPTRARSSASADATGWYVEVSPRGVRTGAGFYEASGPRLAALPRRRSPTTLRRRAREDPPRAGAEGLQIGGDRLKTTPRGYDADHPRIDLLRHKSLIAAGRSGSSR